MRRKSIKFFVILISLGLLAGTFAIANDQSVTGTIEKTDQGIVISSNDGDTYIVMGKDLSELVGQTVKATGTLAECREGKTLTVISIEPVEN